MRHIQEIMEFNMRTLGAPDLVDKNCLGDAFFYDDNKDHIVEYAIRYFSEEPKQWSMPAKNYFVRICLSHYLSKKFNYDFKKLMDTNKILPYDDQFSPIYSRGKEIYDRILFVFKDIPYWKEPGYLKTIEVFEYLYKPILKPITIGYNGDGQEFFDLISFKKKHIIEYYASLFHKMRQMPLNPDEELRRLASCNTYGIPANLLLNTPDENNQALSLIQKVKETINLRSVSILSLKEARAIKEKYPELIVHLSTHGAFNLRPEDYASGCIDVLNVSEPWYLKQKKIIAAAKENGVKIKYIVNRGCLINKWENMSALIGKTIHCNDFGTGDGTGGDLSGCEHVCYKLLKKYPWLALSYVNLQKEHLLFNKDIDIVKISTRDNPLEEVKNLLDYWTSYKPTERILDLSIKDYDTFIEWCKYRIQMCNGFCYNCKICKTYYEKFIA